MKTLKVTLAILAIGVGALVAATAAETLLSPRAAANAPRVVTATAAVAPAAGNPHAMGCMSGASAPTASADAMAHCKTPKKGHAHTACCN
jgi:hypothetical protein